MFAPRMWRSARAAGTSLLHSTIGGDELVVRFTSAGLIGGHRRRPS